MSGRSLRTLFSLENKYLTLIIHSKASSSFNKDKYLLVDHLDPMVLVRLVLLDFQWLPALLGNLLNLVFPALPSYLVVQAILPYHLFQVGQIFQVILAFLGSL